MPPQPGVRVRAWTTELASLTASLAPRSLCPTSPRWPIPPVSWLLLPLPCSPHGVLSPWNLMGCYFPLHHPLLVGRQAFGNYLTAAESACDLQCELAGFTFLVSHWWVGRGSFFLWLHVDVGETGQALLVDREKRGSVSSYAPYECGRGARGSGGDKRLSAALEGRDTCPGWGRLCYWDLYVHLFRAVALPTYWDYVLEKLSGTMDQMEGNNPIFLSWQLYPSFQCPEHPDLGAGPQWHLAGAVRLARN